MQAPEDGAAAAGRDNVQEVRGALLLISMAAAVQPDMVADNLDTLLQVCALSSMLVPKSYYQKWPKRSASHPKGLCVLPFTTQWQQLLCMPCMELSSVRPFSWRPAKMSH